MLSDAALPVPASLASLLAWFAPLFTPTPEEISILRLAWEDLAA
jgi:hypothetical protein